MPFLEKTETFKKSQAWAVDKTETLLESMLTHIIDHFQHVDAQALIDYLRDLFYPSCKGSPPNFNTPEDQVN